MVKTTKRSRKFIAKGGTPKTLLEKKKGTSLTKKGRTKRGGKNGAGRDGGKGVPDVAADDDGGRAERERASRDFTNADDLGQVDMDSFFSQAVAGLADGDDGGGGDDDGDSDVGDEGSDEGGSDSDDDSYASLGSDDDDVGASEAQMKAALDDMARQDPDFHQYLQENESSLLEYGEEDAEDAPEPEDDEEQGTAPLRQRTRQPAADGAADKFLLTPLRLGQLERGAFGPARSIKGLKRVVAAYRTACHLSDANRQDDDADSDDEGRGGGKGGGGGKKKEFQITSPAVFDRLMAVCLTRCKEEFHYHLLGEGSGAGGEKEEKDEIDGDNDDEKDASKELDVDKPLHPKLLARSPNFPALRPLLESFFKSTLHLLGEAGKEAKLLQFVLSAMAGYVPYLAGFPRAAKALLRVTVRLWSAPLDTSEAYHAVRLRAFLRLRQLAITQPFPLIEDALKLAYLAYAKRARFGTAANASSVLPTLTFMGNCVVELYTLDYASAYQHAFVYVRQLALHLRSATMKRTEEAMGTVLCWQYVHCLKLWVAVLSAACGGNGAAKPGGGAGKDEEANLLRSLVYPLTEIILGACRLSPVARFVPLRLHCVRLLQQLASATETFVPTTLLLLGVLDLREVGRKPLRDGGRKGGKKKGGNAPVRGLRLPLILKLPKENTLRTMEQLDGVLKEVFVLLNREADLYRYSPGFPELTFAILQRLRKFNKEISNGRWRAYSKGTIELCEKYAAFAMNGRATLTEAPKDVRRLEALRPVNVPSMGERYEAAVGREKRLEAALQPATTKAPGGKGRTTGNGDRTQHDRKRKDSGGDESDSDAELEEEEVQEEIKPEKKKKKKKAKVVNEADLKNVEALKEEDEVEEGVVWSDSD